MRVLRTTPLTNGELIERVLQFRGLSRGNPEEIMKAIKSEPTFAHCVLNSPKISGIEGSYSYERTDFTSACTMGEFADAHLVHRNLEMPNWPPWFSDIFTTEMFVAMKQICPEGQIVIKTKRKEGPPEVPIASLNMARIFWNGDPNTLPSWDLMIHGPVNFERLYDPKGDTFVMLNINVHKDFRSLRLPSKLIEEAIQVARESGVKRLIGAFRPSEYGAYKLSCIDGKLGFVDIAAYCEAKRDDGLPSDGWLRVLARNRMSPLRMDYDTMVIHVPVSKFMDYKAVYNPERWRIVYNKIYECGESGAWFMNRDGTATYKESRLFGALREF